MSKIYFETERLRIREAEEGDAGDLLELYTDPEVLKYNCISPATPEKIENGIKNGWYKFAIELKSEKKIIGTIGFSNDELRYMVESCCISYELNTKYTKKGYMTEALSAFIRYCFDELGVDAISARVFDKNESSLKLIKKLGFTHEGTLRYAVRASSGIVYNDCIFSLLKTEL